MADHNKKHHRSPQHNQKQQESASSQQKSIGTQQPKDYPLVPLTDAVKELEKAYCAHQNEGNVYQKKQLVIQGLLCLVTFLAFAAAAYYAYVSHEQWQDLRRNFQIQERPWLSLETEPVNGLSFVNGKQAALVLKFLIKNVGHSIAKNIQVDAKMFPSAAGVPMAPDAIRRQRELCDHPKINQIGLFDLFPLNEPAVREMHISVIASETEKQSVSNPSSNPRKFVGFYVVGCATYRSSFSPGFHQTRFSYHLSGPGGFDQDGRPLVINGMPIMGAFEVGVNVPKDKLVMWHELFGQNEAN